ncbi:MAG: bla [Acidobacteria bacterium]|nr:bla [Acidobacteriota bacterium]
MRLSGCLLSIFAIAAGGSGQAAARPPAMVCKADAGWNDPARPRHVFGNTWYVGTCGISALLVTSDKGHILIDGATREAAPQIEANIRALGFRIKDVRFILATHAHLDHAGGFAALRRASGAVMVARGADADAIERGRGDRSDPQFTSIDGFPPVAHVRRVADAETLTLGPLSITAHATPGHTPGSTSWTWDSCEGPRCLHIAYVDSVSPISDDVYRYTDEAQHPGVVEAFRKSIAAVAALPCDVLLTPHPFVSNMFERMGANATAPLADANACRQFAAQASDKLDERLTKERATPTRKEQ